MDSESIARINTAVDQALERCAGSREPPAALGEFLKELKESGQLTPHEIMILEDAVSRATQ
jgi:hypothetical protein